MIAVHADGTEESATERFEEAAKVSGFLTAATSVAKAVPVLVDVHDVVRSVSRRLITSMGTAFR